MRGGFGTFYDLGTGQTANAFIGFPYVSGKFLVGVPFPLSPADAAPPPFSLQPPFGDIVAFDPELELPRTYQWNVTVEQSLGADQTVSAAYVAAVGRRLLRQEQLVAPSPDFTSCVRRKSNHGCSPSSAGSTRTAPCRSRFAFCSRIMSVSASISG